MNTLRTEHTNESFVNTEDILLFTGLLIQWTEPKQVMVVSFLSISKSEIMHFSYNLNTVHTCVSSSLSSLNISSICSCVIMILSPSSSQ